MRKITLIAMLFMALGFGINAQEVGIRFGNSYGTNAAVDAIFSTGEFSRLHADISFGGGVGFDILWDFVYKPLEGEAFDWQDIGTFNWYAGVGPYTFIGNDFELGVVGELGLEYRFDNVPVVIGADWRPNFEIIENTSFGADGFGLNVRWVFGK